MRFLRGLFYSLPIQLLFLHFRKYQVLVLLWGVLFAAVGGDFMKTFGAESLFLSPEYLGEVNALSAAILGAAVGGFIMSWNITTFILFSRHFSFLAATRFPFLKYCINNAVLPLIFLLFFLFRGFHFSRYTELMGVGETIGNGLGFLGGLLLVFLVSFAYFFRADRTILRNLEPLFSEARRIVSVLKPESPAPVAHSLIRSEWFLDSLLRVRRSRDVSHYTPTLMGKIFQRHHLAAVVCIGIAYLILIAVGFFVDTKAFQIPAAASITLLLAIGIGVAGAGAFFFQSWSIPALLLLLIGLNFFYKRHWFDPHSKAFGLSYTPAAGGLPQYNEASLQALANWTDAAKDKKAIEAILDGWKARQGEDKPLLVLIATSGGGSRSATFTVNALQRLDSAMGGTLMRRTALITGASGGMIGATYYRELTRRRDRGEAIDPNSPAQIDAIARDLLNPTFSSFVARDLLAPSQRFSVAGHRYTKDRGYSFEWALNRNTGGLLNQSIGDYAADERAARVPMAFYHNVITRDGKKLLISPHPLRFMMRPAGDSAAPPPPDGVDYQSFFAAQAPRHLRLLTVLRMNATFPVVLPNVWLPTQPEIDVMDGGLRDNYGVETALRFVSHMEGWIKRNTRGVLLIRLRDRVDGGWEQPYDAESLTENALKPFLLLQHNWFKMMEYNQADMAAFLRSNRDVKIYPVPFQYTPSSPEKKAALSFHLSQRERRDVVASLGSPLNQLSFARLQAVLGGRDSVAGKPPAAPLSPATPR